MQDKKLSFIGTGIFYILLVVVSLIAFMGLYIGINFIQAKLFVKGEYIIYLIKSPYSYLLFLILIIAIGRIEILFVDKKKLLSKDNGSSLWLKCDKLLILAIIIFIYMIVTSVVVVTKDGIYDYSFFNLKGNKYDFSDVEYVHTGFGDSGKSKGEFFYNITLKNGKKLKLAYPSSSQSSKEYKDDSWQEYVDIDQYIMNSGAKKESSEKGSNYVKMDKKYIDKLLKIVNNK